AAPGPWAGEAAAGPAPPGPGPVASGLVAARAASRPRAVTARPAAASARKWLAVASTTRVELALALGVAAERIDTIADYAAAAKYGVKTDGGAEAGPGAQVLAELAGLIA